MLHQSKKILSWKVMSKVPQNFLKLRQDWVKVLCFCRNTLLRPPMESCTWPSMAHGPAAGPPSSPSTTWVWTVSAPSLPLHFCFLRSVRVPLVLLSLPLWQVRAASPLSSSLRRCRRLSRTSPWFTSTLRGKRRGRLLTPQGMLCKESFVRT